MEKKMSDPKKTPQTPKQQPTPPSPKPTEFPGQTTEKRGLPPVDQTPAMPPVKPPK
jgi:hypothetical protein